MTPSMPAWVMKRDGRREPFDADKISQGLYAATEAIGAANAFLARELADSVLHFLGQESPDETVKATQIAELVEKVVRELGQPVLAHAFLENHKPPAETGRETKTPSQQAEFTFSSDESLDEVRSRCLETYSLHAVFGRDIAAAHRAELIHLWGLLFPRVLDTLVMDAPTSGAMSSWRYGWTQVRDARARTATLVVDSAERFVACCGPEWLEGFRAALEAYGGMPAILDVNVASPPPWAGSIASGPLFASAKTNTGTDGARDDALATVFDALQNDLRKEEKPHWCVNWHLQEADLEGSARKSMLNRFEQVASWCTFSLDRPTDILHLGAGGLDRRHPAISLRVGLPLTKFFRHPGIDGNGATMIAKLPSLVRMAVSAGIQKRNYLRRSRPELSRGFLLDRARLLIEPWDLDEVICLIAGTRPSKSKLALELGQKLLQTLHEAAVEAGRKAGLDAVVANFQGVWVDERFERDEPETAWRSAGALLKILDCGTVRVRLPQLSSERVWQHLQYAWRTPGVCRVHFVRG